MTHEVHDDGNEVREPEVQHIIEKRDASKHQQGILSGKGTAVESGEGDKCRPVMRTKSSDGGYLVVFKNDDKVNTLVGWRCQGEGSP
jgi:hypothetical protein